MSAEAYEKLASALDAMGDNKAADETREALKRLPAKSP